MRTATIAPLRLALASLLATVLFASSARADSGGRLTADLDLGSTTDFSTRMTVGGALRFGWRFDLGRVWLEPEIGGAYAALTGVGCDFCRGMNHTLRGFGGMRLGGAGLLAGVIEPALFGHVGYGRVLGAHEYNADPSTGGPAADVGFAIDAVLTRHFRFGGQAAYNVIATRDEASSAPPPKWITFGLHAGVAF
jgi:hypothetical protein